jgi:hypothetical protein
VRDHSGVASVFRHFDRSQSFGQRTDLVEFDQDGVNDAFLDTFFQDLGVGYEQIVTNQLDFVAQYFGLWPVYVIAYPTPFLSAPETH